MSGHAADDEWCDTSASSEAPTPVKKTEKKRGDANKLRSVSITVKKISMEEEVKLLPYSKSFPGVLPSSGIRYVGALWFAINPEKHRSSEQDTLEPAE